MPHDSNTDMKSQQINIRLSICRKSSILIPPAATVHHKAFIKRPSIKTMGLSV